MRGGRDAPPPRPGSERGRPRRASGRRRRPARLGIEPRQTQPPDHRAGHRDELVGQSVDDRAGGRVAVHRRGEHDRRQLAGRAARRSRPSYIAIVSARGDGEPEVGRARSAPGRVRGPRPSRARTAAASPAQPTSVPPPQSPEMSPSASSRAVRPSGATPAALTPCAADHDHAPAPVRAGPQRARTCRCGAGRSRANPRVGQWPASAAGRRPACRRRRAQ